MDKDTEKSIDGFRVSSGESTNVPVSSPGSAAYDTTPAGANTDVQTSTPAPGFTPPATGDNPQTVPAVDDRAPVLADTKTDVKTEVEVLRHKNKSLKVWLVVLLVGLTAAIVGFGVYFVQTNKAQQDLDTAQAQNQQLQQQINEQNATSANKQINSLQTQVDDLTAQNKTLTSQNETLTKQVSTLNSYITELTATANKLKTTCGTACSSITIPPAPTGTSTSN